MNHTKRIATLAIGAALLAAACTGSASTASSQVPANPSGEPLSGTVTIDGSSTVFLITAAVAEEFENSNQGAVKVPVAFSGTGGGFKKFCIGETDINDASRPIKKDDEGEGLACTANGIEYVELQIAIDGLSVVVNPANDWATCLTVAELKAIYGPDSPEKLLWSDVRAGFPAEQVNRFMPGADSGTFDYFTEAINGETDASTTFATQNEDDNPLVTGVAGDTYGIGYFGYAYYVQNKDKIRAIGVDGGSGCVEPSEATINDNSYAPLSRPLFIYPDVGKAQERPELAAFVDFYLANAQQLAADPDVGYVAVPDDTLEAEKDEWTAALQ